MLRVSEDGNNHRESYIANYRQIRNSLTILQNAADQIFDSISERTANESAKLADLSNRIRSAKARVDAVSQMKKQVIRIKSASRYPVKYDEEEDFQALFGYKDGTTTPVAELLVNGGLSREFGVDGTFELFKYFSETTTFDSVQEDAMPKLGGSTSTSLLDEANDAEDALPKPKHQNLPLPPPSLLHN